LTLGLTPSNSPPLLNCLAYSEDLTFLDLSKNFLGMKLIYLFIYLLFQNFSSLFVPRWSFTSNPCQFYSIFTVFKSFRSQLK